MGAAVAIRTDIEAGELRRLARQETDGRVAARLLGLANVLDGMRRAEAARAAGMDRQTLRDWVIRFNADGIAGLSDQPRSGRPPWLTEGEQAALKAVMLRLVKSLDLSRQKTRPSHPKANPAAQERFKRGASPRR